MTQKLCACHNLFVGSFASTPPTVPCYEATVLGFLEFAMPSLKWQIQKRGQARRQKGLFAVTGIPLPVRMLCRCRSAWIYPVVRVYGKIGRIVCNSCGEIVAQPPQQIIDAIAAASSKALAEKRVAVVKRVARASNTDAFSSLRPYAMQW